jgi:hypothetical protein
VNAVVGVVGAARAVVGVVGLGAVGGGVFAGGARSGPRLTAGVVVTGVVGGGGGAVLPVGGRDPGGAAETGRGSVAVGNVAPTATVIGTVVGAAVVVVVVVAPARPPVRGACARGRGAGPVAGGVPPGEMLAVVAPEAGAVAPIEATMARNADALNPATSTRVAAAGWRCRRVGARSTGSGAAARRAARRARRSSRSTVGSLMALSASAGRGVDLKRDARNVRSARAERR